MRTRVGVEVTAHSVSRDPSQSSLERSWHHKAEAQERAGWHGFGIGIHAALRSVGIMLSGLRAEGHREERREEQPSSHGGTEATAVEGRTSWPASCRDNRKAGSSPWGQPGVISSLLCRPPIQGAASAATQAGV